MISILSLILAAAFGRLVSAATPNMCKTPSFYTPDKSITVLDFEGTCAQFVDKGLKDEIWFADACRSFSIDKQRYLRWGKECCTDGQTICSGSGAAPPNLCKTPSKYTPDKVVSLKRQSTVIYNGQCNALLMAWHKQKYFGKIAWTEDACSGFSKAQTDSIALTKECCTDSQTICAANSGIGSGTQTISKPNCPAAMQVFEANCATSGKYCTEACKTTVQDLQTACGKTFLELYPTAKNCSGCFLHYHVEYWVKCADEIKTGFSRCSDECTDNLQAIMDTCDPEKDPFAKQYADNGDDIINVVAKPAYEKCSSDTSGAVTLDCKNWECTDGAKTTVVGVMAGLVALTAAVVF